MALGKSLAFHSYKGGTGKTTLISNLAAFYAKTGLKVCLLDFDLYAPSLSIYFRKTPNYYLNDLLEGKVNISDVIVDVSSELDLKGKLFLGFSSPRKEDINDIEIKHELKWQIGALKKFLAAKNQLFEDFKINYLLLDTSPGIRYWSINALATADMLFLLMKMSDMDIEGTKKMTADIYDSLARFGSKYYLILNKVQGAQPAEESSWEADENAWQAELSKAIGAQVIGSIPCFCDIQFSRHEFLFSIKQPDHPFSKRLVALAEKIRNIGLTKA